MAEKFQYNAEEALKLINRHYRIVIFQDGLGSITAIAIPKGKSLDGGVLKWRNHKSCDYPNATLEDIQRSVFEGPEKYSGCGFTVASALHSLVEKVMFNRLPAEHDGEYHYPPEKKDQGDRS